jgi:hypothetical protein
MVSQANLKILSRGGGRYILCMPIHRGGEVATEVITRPGRYQEVAENLRVKEVVVGEGERRRRYVVCFNPQEAARQHKHREQVLKELEAELESLHHSADEPHTKRLCQLRSSARYGPYIRLTKTGKPMIDKAVIRQREHLDGKFIVHSNDDTLSAEDMALGYKQLQRVEEAWRTLKSGLRMRPVYHWTPHRICAHVSISVLALLLERVAELACGDTWRNIRDDLKQIKLAQLLSPNGTVWQVTEPGLEGNFSFSPGKGARQPTPEELSYGHGKGYRVTTAIQGGVDAGGCETAGNGPVLGGKSSATRGRDRASER